MTGRNVLFILSDEHDPRVSGCGGHPLVRTPNLDRLARRGTVFPHAFTPSPICVPARASLATGRWVHDIGYWDNAIAYDGRVPGWAHRAEAAGHRVESIGKLHFRNAADPTGFGAQHAPMHIHAGSGQVWGSVRDPMPAERGRSPLFDEIGAGESKYNRYDMESTRRAVEWLHARGRSPDPTPWLLQVGYVAPHFPLVVPQRYLDLYPPDRMPLPKLRPSEGYRRHPWVEASARYMPLDEALGTDDRRRLAIACYLALVTFLDDQVGTLLEALESAGLMDNTVIVYSSDHGDNLGARGLWNKCVLYAESTRVPMIVAGRGVPIGLTRHTNANLVDLHPTFLEMLGVPPHPDDADLPGRSLLALAAAPDDPARIGFSEYHAVGSVSAGYMVACDRWKYHHYVGFAPELFDLASDPEEAHDLAGDSAHRATLAEMEGRLRAMLDPERVDRRAKDDQNALVARYGGRERALGVGPRGATPVPGA